ncbi:MAG: phosphocholine cytidylyltransferase family protein [Epsilonproteobacteria bacterium]|nr:MAG: phosphocholine cytidylyltransferase family protein [Campylobacterota bacterium]
MKVIIMAAGIGSRLTEVSHDQPKCLIKAGEETLIKRIVRLCKDRGLDDISIVTGYKAKRIEEEIGENVTYFENPFYSVTNSISSLWLAKEKLDDDLLLMNADLFFEPVILDKILALKQDVVMLSDSTRIETADYRFSFKNDLITKYGKHLSNQETDGEYVGIVRINKSFVKSFKTRLKEMISSGKINDWWEDVLYSFIPQGSPINHSDIAGHFWTEIDYLSDYHRLQDWLARPRQKNESTSLSLAEGIN